MCPTQRFSKPCQNCHEIVKRPKPATREPPSPPGCKRSILASLGGVSRKPDFCTFSTTATTATTPCHQRQQLQVEHRQQQQQGLPTATTATTPETYIIPPCTLSKFCPPIFRPFRNGRVKFGFLGVVVGSNPAEFRDLSAICPPWLSAVLGTCGNRGVGG